MKVNEIKTPVSTISGVGPQLTKNLSKLNVFTVGDLLQYYPYNYEDRSVKITLDQYKTNPKIHTVARVMSHEWFGYGKMRTLKININDGTAPAQLICFNRAFLENQLPVGAVITVTGAFYVKYNTLQSTAFEAAKMNFEGEATAATLKTMQPLNTGIIPVYHLTEGITQKVLHKTMAAALSQYAHGIEDELPSEIIAKRGLMTKQQAIQSIHEPKSYELAQEARKTLAYEELYHLQYAIAQRAFKHRGTLPPDLEPNGPESTEQSDFTPEIFRTSLSPLQRQLLDKLSFELTPDQQKVIYQMNCEIDTGFTQRYKKQQTA